MNRVSGLITYGSVSYCYKVEMDTYVFRGNGLDEMRFS